MTEPVSTNELAERWLRDAAIELSPRFPEAYPVPDLRYRVGAVPGTKGTSRKVTASYIAPERTADRVPQLYVSPLLSDARDVLTALTHELIHAATRSHSHGAAFHDAARHVGLDGGAEDPQPQADLSDTFAAIVDQLGPYPHAAVEPDPLRQSARQLLHVCPACGAKFRAPKSAPIPLCDGIGDQDPDPRAHPVARTVRQ